MFLFVLIWGVHSFACDDTSKALHCNTTSGILCKPSIIKQSNKCFPAQIKGYCQQIITIEECNSNYDLCYWFSSDIDKGNIQEPIGECMDRSLIGPCEQYYTSYDTCLGSNQFQCIWQNNKCEDINSSLTLACDMPISQHACQTVLQGTCTLRKNKCQPLDAIKSCSEIFNEQACSNYDTEQLQCEWRLNPLTLNGICEIYNPPECTKKANRLTCMRIQNSCLWMLSTQTCTIVQKKDICSSDSYVMNPYGCKENTHQNCNFNAKTQSCSPVSGEINSCDPEYSRKACQESKAKCGWSDGCVEYDSEVHTCNSGLSHSACRNALLPCKWDVKLGRCQLIENPSECLVDMNEVACLLLPSKCIWKHINGSDFFCSEWTKAIIEQQQVSRNSDQSNYDIQKAYNERRSIKIVYDPKFDPDQDELGNSADEYIYQLSGMILYSILILLYL